jgi:hypothetical protein
MNGLNNKKIKTIKMKSKQTNNSNNEMKNERQQI